VQFFELPAAFKEGEKRREGFKGEIEFIVGNIEPLQSTLRWDETVQGSRDLIISNINTRDSHVLGKNWD
jgi:hypothetical protein